jgi:hypothetical protein
LPLELIVDHTNQAIIRIEEITEKIMDQPIKDFFLSEIGKQKILLSPWMYEYYKAKEKSTDSYLWLKKQNSI